MSAITGTATAPDSSISRRTRWARAGEPGAGYSTSNSSLGNPPKSWMVRGRSISVTAVSGTYQWAETDNTAVGRGSARPSPAQASANRLGSMAYIGLPWPMKATGMR